MKKSRISCLSFILISLTTGSAMASMATIAANDSWVYSDMAGTQKGMAVVPGAPYQIEKQGEEMTLIVTPAGKGWVKNDEIAVFDGTFSDIDEGVILSSKIPDEVNQDYLYYYSHGKMIRYDIARHSADSAKKSPAMADIVAGGPKGLFLLEGVTTNGLEVRHYQIYQFNQDKSVFIGSFGKAQASILSARFSPSGKYLAILYQFDGSRNVCLYRVDNGQMFAWGENISSISWQNDQLVLNDRKYFWVINADNPGNPDIGYRDELKLFAIQSKWGGREGIESDVYQGKLLIQTTLGVLEYDPSDRKLKKSVYRSLTISPSGNMNFYTKGSRSYLMNLKTTNYLSEFAGSEPSADFITFSGDTVIGRKKYEKIDTLFLFAPDGKEIYRYKAVDNPSAFGRDGIVAELYQEKDMAIIAVEMPRKEEFYLILDREGK